MNDERSDLPAELDPRTMRRARAAYELSRAKRALLYALPALGFSALLLAEGAAPTEPRVLASVGLYLSAVLALFLGQGAGAAVVPSLLLGLVPFTIVRVAESAGHVCLGEACVSWCLPACLLGGLAGGALVGARGRRETDRLGYALTATTMVFLAGAVGCRCAGNAGLAGLALGAVLGSAVPLLVARRGHEPG